jgi:hypothetical protein
MDGHKVGVEFAPPAPPADVTGTAKKPIGIYVAGATRCDYGSEQAIF